MKYFIGSCNLLSLVCLLIIGFGVISNLWLMTNNYSNLCLYSLTFFSFLVSVSSIKIFTAREQIEKVAHLNKNINEAQKLIKNLGLGLFKYGKIDIYKGNPTSLTITEIASDPVSWVMCIALFYGLFFTNTYVEFNGQDFEKVVHLGFVFLFQILLLSFAISGVGVFIYKKIKRLA